MCELVFVTFNSNALCIAGSGSLYRIGTCNLQLRRSLYCRIRFFLLDWNLEPAAQPLFALPDPVHFTGLQPVTHFLLNAHCS